jgi:hypothetical protein
MHDSDSAGTLIATVSSPRSSMKRARTPDSFLASITRCTRASSAPVTTSALLLLMWLLERLLRDLLLVLDEESEVRSYLHLLMVMIEA